MIIKDRSYPHPVLAPFKDDVSPNDFSCALKVTPDADNFYFSFQFEYENVTLDQLIRDKKAAHCVHIECRQNFYRRIFSFPERTRHLSIPANELVGRVEVTGLIKSLDTIDAYRIAGAHSDYGDISFRIQPGDVLAVSPSATFDAFVDYDPLRQISSILTIRRSPDQEEGGLEVDTQDDRIVATLSQRDFDRYADLKADPTLSALLANQVVVPAILVAIQEIRQIPESDTELEMQKRWFRSISKKLEDLGIDIRAADDPTLKAAQLILQLPLRRSLEGLIQINPLEEKNEATVL